MSTVTVTGYYDDGVAYALALDDSEDDVLTGVIVAGPSPLITQIEASGGTSAPLHPLGGDVPMGVHSISGVLTYLRHHTQVVEMKGDLPAELAEDPEDAATIAVQ